MRNSTRGTLSMIAALAVAACGGPDKPANSAGDPPPPIDAPPVDKGGAASSSSAAKPDVLRGTKALEAGDLPAAKEAFEAAVQKAPKDATAHYYLGLALDKAGDKAGAEKRYKEALSLKADLDEAAQNLCALYIESGRFGEAVDLAKASRARNPKSAGIALNHAVALAGAGDREAAERAFEEAARLAPKDPMPLLTWAAHLGQWKKPDVAAQKLRDAEKIAGDDVGVLASIAFEMKNVGAYKECIGVLDRAIPKKPAAELLTYRSLCKYGAKDAPGAKKDLEEAIAKEPSYAPAHYYLGGRLGEEGKLADAAREFRKYLELEPNGPLAKAAQAKLKLAEEKGAGGKKKK